MDREKRGSGVLVVFGVCFSLFVAFMFYEVSGCICLCFCLRHLGRLSMSLMGGLASGKRLIPHKMYLEKTCCTTTSL
jgi:hypothetical protein